MRSLWREIPGPISIEDMVDIPFIARGFKPRRPAAPPGRLPPGQYTTTDFPVLSAGPTPRTPLERWDFTIRTLRRPRRALVVEDFMALPRETPTVDIHCVTKWSKFDTTWEGVSIDALVRAAEITEIENSSSLRSATAVTRRIFRCPTSPAARRGSCSDSAERRFRPNTAGRLGCSCLTCISGRARNGCAGSVSSSATSRVSGSSSAITIAVIRGESSAIRATRSLNPR